MYFSPFRFVKDSDFIFTRAAFLEKYKKSVGSFWDMKAKRTKSFTKFMGWTIAFLMVASAFGVVFYGFNTSNSPDLIYEGYQFTPTQFGYSVTIDDQAYDFYYLPQSIGHLTIPDDIMSLLTTAPVLTITYDENSSLKEASSLFQFSFNHILGSRGVFVQSALTKPNTYGLPELTCLNATSYSPVIFIKESVDPNIFNTSITRDGGCIIIQAHSPPEVVQYQDRILYTLLGVMK